MSSAVGWKRGAEEMASDLGYAAGLAGQAPMAELLGGLGCGCGAEAGRDRSERKLDAGG